MILVYIRKVQNKCMQVICHYIHRKKMSRLRIKLYGCYFTGMRIFIFFIFFPNRIGGRVKSVSPKDGEGIVELGATCIHGATPENPVYALTEEWNLPGDVLIR